jgi:hypothetical protein
MLNISILETCFPIWRCPSWRPRARHRRIAATAGCGGIAQPRKLALQLLDARDFDFRLHFSTLQKRRRPAR